MSRTIWKFPLDLVDVQKINIPEAFEPLSVQVQGEQPCLWASVYAPGNLQEVTIYCHGTGHAVHPNAGKHLGTVQWHGLVFHFFLERPR